MLRVGLLGAGTIGSMLGRALDPKHPDSRRIAAQLVAIADRDRSRAEALAAELSTHPPVVSLDKLIAASDLTIEAASQAALTELVPKTLERNRDLMVLSVGGLLGREDWFREANQRGCRIHVPSGALAGLDAIRSASVGEVESVELISRKPAAALAASEYLRDRGFCLESLECETVVFEGSAEEAAHLFPTTSNVAASLRLVVRRPVPVRVRILAVPDGTHNIHEIRAKGEFGRLRILVENVPSPENPRTSRLAGLSAIATLERLTSSLSVGS